MGTFSEKNANELENRLIGGGLAVKKMKRKFYDYRMARLETSLKRAKSEEKKKHFENLRAGTLDKYNKYNNTSFTS
jgi:hypothetical protein